MVERILITAVCLMLSAVSLRATAEEALASPSQSVEESEARQRSAEDSFLNIIAPQNQDFDNAVRMKAKPKAPMPSVMSGNELPVTVPEILAPPPEESLSPQSCVSNEACTATFSLDAYEKLKERLRKQREDKILLEGPAVILGASEYTGKAVDGVLSLNLKLRVILGAGDKWKIVPLVGEDVVLAAARVDNALIPTARRDGYVVWATRKTGEIVIDMDLLVPSRGPRGSIEYDFFAPKTPVTTFSCFFPVGGLEPRIAEARSSSALERDGGTAFEAVLKPTSRIHFIGYKDIGSEEEGKAGLFTETLNLVSIAEGSLDLFSVFRYTILYAGAKTFDIEIPKDMTVVSVEGQSAFRFDVEESGDKTLLRGETAVPVRNNFEISLRLKRRLSASKEPFQVPLPHARNAAREHGWVAVEVPGKLQITEKEKKEIAAIDVRQLPEEMVRSAVSPIIKAYRYHGNASEVILSAAKLPEKEPDSASVDKVRVFTVISRDGKMLTDMRIRMRNRLRPSLSMRLQDDVKLLSVHLDGEAVRPSREGRNTVILPLKRSGGPDGMEPFALQVVLEKKDKSMGLLGRSDFDLPALDLPVSTVEWTVYAPASNTYSALRGMLALQTRSGEASWYTSPFSSAPVRTFVAAGDGEVETVSDGAGTAAVRIDLPKTGTRLDWSGYWFNANKPVGVHVYYARSRLLVPVGVAAALLFIWGGVLLFSPRIGRRVFGAVAACAACYPIYKTLGTFGLEVSVFLSIAVLAYKKKTFAMLRAWAANWTATFVARFKERDREETQIKVSRIIWGLSMCVLCLILAGAGAAFVNLLFTPY